MRKTLAIGTTALALLFGGAGVANATEIVATPTTTAVAQEVDNDDGDSKDERSADTPSPEIDHLIDYDKILVKGFFLCLFH